MPLACGSTRARTFSILVVALLLSPVAAAAATPSEDPESATRSHVAEVQVTLCDAHSRRPVPDASVSWRAGSRRGSGTTDSAGRLSFAVGTAAETPSGYGGREHVLLSVTANVYRPERRLVLIERAGTTHVDIALAPRSRRDLGVLLGVLSNADTGRGIAHADVAVIGSGASLTTTTDADGVFHIAPVGFSRSLRLRFTTKVPPCIRPFERTLVVEHPAQAVLASAKDLRLPVVHCPGGPFGPVTGGKPSL